MKWIKFLNAYLITFTAVVLCCFNILLCGHNANAQRFVVQIAASQDFIDIQKFAKDFTITDSIVEIRGEDWTRYVVGNFENREMASRYAKEIVKNTGLKEAFPKMIEDNLSNIDIAQVNDTIVQVVDSIKVNSEIEKTRTETYSASSKTENQESYNPNSLNKKEELSISYTYRNRLIMKMIGEDNVQVIKRKLIDYGNTHFSSKQRPYYFRFINHTLKYPIIVVFGALICIFILHVLILLTLLSFSNRLKNYNERYIKIYSGLYEKVILSYLFGDIDWDTFYIKLKKINKEKNRGIITSILLNFHNNLKGEVDKHIPEIFVKLNLQKDSFKRINSIFYFKKVKGLHELTYLYPEGALKVLPDLLNHSNESMCSEAQKAYILLHPDHPFDFLLTLKKPFSRWTQLSAFYLLRLPQLQIPSFSKYLRSNHYGVQIFCLQMINYFQQLENISLIFNLLDSQRELTRFLAYKAINNLRLSDGRVLIKKEYRDETEKNKKEIVKALRNIGTDEDIDFLEIIFRSESISLRIEACRTMYYMSSESRERLLNVSEKAVPELDLYIAHVTDKRN